MKRFLRILRSVALVLVLLLLLLGSGGYVWLRSTLPQLSGSVRVQGLSAPVEITRDSDAVPHIRAQSETDALFGLGYVHAQDRLWQMEFQRRTGYGRLSEILGSASLEADRFMRTLGPARAAASAWPQLDQPTQRLIEAYVAGVNAYIAQGQGIAPEFAMLGVTPEPWRPQDVLLWIKLMAYNLGNNWNEELLRVRLTAKLGAAQAAELMPFYTPDGPIILPNGVAGLSGGPAQASRLPTPDTAQASAGIDQLLAIHQRIQQQLGLHGIAVGSNSWVVSGARSTTGQPLLANDPHLNAQIPSIWYLAHLQGGQLDAIGATLPGVAGIVVGHNQRIAWGVTNTGPDVQDLFIEDVDDQDRVLYRGAREPLQIIDEQIKVRGQADVPLRVRVSRHGPLISDVVEDTGDTLAFRWTALDAEDHTLTAFLNLNLANNWQEFTAALEHYHAPMQNFVYADVDGNIGYYAPGALPMRGSGDGTAPAPGASGEYDWQGYVPFAELPHAYNPPEGYIATANNKAVPDSYPYLISTKWEAPYRAMRIIEMLEAKPKLSADDMAAMQADVRSAQARQLLPYLMQAETDDSRARQAIELLRNWDGTLGADTTEAAVYRAWYRRIPVHMFADEVGDEVWETYGSQRDYLAMQLPPLLREENSKWCDDVTTAEAESCPQILGNALVDGLTAMERAQGTGDITAWRWAKVHRVIFAHQPFGTIWPLSLGFDRSVPNGGDGFTVNLGSHNSAFEQRDLPSYRQIIDLSDLDASRFMHTVGQSGHVLSADYSNLITRWQQVQYLPMRYTAASIEASTRDRLVLEPAAAR